MPPGEHVHIISAGEKIHTTYPAIFRTLPTITRTYVIADSEVYELSSNPAIEKERLAIRNAVTAVKEISASLAIPCSRETVFPPAYPSVRTILTKIHREYHGARFTFDLSGGSKPLCMALLSFVPWLGGEAYSAFDEKLPRIIPLTERSVRGMMENSNYQTILAVLLRKQRMDTSASSSIRVPRHYLHGQVWPYYIRSRTRGPPDPAQPVIQYRRGRKPANNMSQATFSWFMANLRNAGLIEEGQNEKNRKEKAYRITEAGDMAFRFYAGSATNTIVKTVLEAL